MSDSTKELAVGQTARELRMGDSEVRVVVNTYERLRTEINRSRRKGSKKSSKGKAVHTGNGWYETPDGDKIHGRKAVEKAGYEIA